MSVGNYASFLYNALGGIGEDLGDSRREGIGLAALGKLPGFNASPSPFTPTPSKVNTVNNVTPTGAGKQVVDYFIQQGYQPHQAAALAGNFQAESNFNTGAMNKGDGRDGSDSIGLAQWNGPRAAALNQYAAQNKLNPNDLNTQLQFANQELNTTEKATKDRLMAAPDVMSATQAAVGYERPAGYTPKNPQGAMAFDKRLAYAQQYAPQNTQVASLDPSAGMAQAEIAGTGSLQPQQAPQQAAQGGLNEISQPAQRNNVPIDVIQDLLRSPTTRAIGQSILQEKVTGKNAGFQYNQEADGTIIGTNLSTGEKSVLRDGAKTRPTPQSDAAKLKADLDAGYITPEQYEKASRGGGSVKPTDIASLRKDYSNQPGVDRYRQAVPIVNSMVASIDNNTAMSDMDFIYGLAKILDPGSVVREGELTLTSGNQSLDQKLIGQFKKAYAGEGQLSPEVRKNLVGVATTRANAYKNQAQEETDYYRGLSERSGINPDDIVRPLGEISQLPGAPVRVNSPEEARKLPKGTKLILPDGSQGEVR